VGKRDFPGSAASPNTFSRIAALAAAGIIGAASPVEAAPSVFWPDYYEPYPPPRFAPPRVRKFVKKRLPANEAAKDARKPQGPLIIAISIEKQALKVYDANGFFAETPISTGMRGHSTPMGVFSVIQKHKYHQSNIYSGAPMPYMQRITWSGVAMHAGVLPGYPASHGCIRMPMNFAVKMWGWTRIGARVVITPGELAPERFSHPLLATQKTAPLADAEPQKNVDIAVTAKSDKVAIADRATTPAYPQTSLELKSTLGHDLAKPAASTHTADASSALSQSGSQMTIIDARVASNRATKADDDAAGAVDKAGDAGDSAKAQDVRSEAAKVEPADFATVKVESVNADAPKDVKKDQTRLSDPEKAAVPNPEPALATAPKRSGQIAVFVSKKDGRLYVRQNFAPLFDAPVTIAPSERPLGTHVFTVQTDKEDANLLHWSAVSMPVVARYKAEQDDDERTSRRRRTTGAIEVKPAPLPDSAAEALDRLTLPADAMARITEALSTGGSIIVSDQGINGGETGEGTDFIIPLR
jgi:lipoprotein-anchoring transpeptidase ErfK/SrfK